MTCSEFAYFDAVKRLLQLSVEIVNPKLVKVAKHNVRRTMRNEIQPVIKCLLVVFGKFFSARLHFNQHAPRPDKICKLYARTRKTDSILKCRTFWKRIGVVVKSLE